LTRSQPEDRFLVLSSEVNETDEDEEAIWWIAEGITRAFAGVPVSRELRAVCRLPHLWRVMGLARLYYERARQPNNRAFLDRRLAGTDAVLKEIGAAPVSPERPTEAELNRIRERLFALWNEQKTNFR